MHNGIFNTLDEVVEFYADGGGVKHGIAQELLDDKIRPFSLTDREKEDLISFLHSLTDESNKPEIPNKVPSCLLYTSPSPRDRSLSRMPSSA